MAPIYHGRTFEKFMAQVDQALVAQVGMTHIEFGDQPYWDYWSSGYTPDQTAKEAIESELEDCNLPANYLD